MDDDFESRSDVFKSNFYWNDDAENVLTDSDKHVKTTTYPYPKCDKHFKRNWDLERHMKNFHTEQKNDKRKRKRKLSKEELFQPKAKM